MTKPLTLRRALCLLLCALLVFFLSATVTRAAKHTPTQTTLSVTANDFTEQMEGYKSPDMEPILTDHGLYFKKTGEADPHLYYPSSLHADTITVTLAEPTRIAVLAHCKDGDWEHAKISYPIQSTTDEAGRISHQFVLNVDNDSNQFSLRFGGEFTLVSVTHEEDIAPGTYYRFNAIALVLFLLSLGVLVLLERKLHFFAEVRDLVKDKWAFATSLPKRQRILHFICTGAFLAFLLVAFLDFALSLTFAFVALLLGVLAVLAVAAILIEGLTLRTDLSFARMFWLVLMVVGTAFALSLPSTTGLAWDDEFHSSYMACPAAFLNLGQLPFSAQNLFNAPLAHSAYFENTEAFANTILKYDGFMRPVGVSPLTFPDVHPVLMIVVAPLFLLYTAYRYFAYLPGILVFTFGFLLRADLIFIISASRMVTLFISATAFAFGIRRLLYGKRVFALCAFLPCALYLSVNFSCDSFISALIALGFAYYIGELQRKDERLSAKNAAIMITALALGCSPKPIYFVLLFPLLLLPKSKLGEGKRARNLRLITLATMVLIVLTFVLPFLINSDSYTDLRGGATVSTTGQITYILTNPFAFLKTFFRFLFDWLALDAVAPYTVFLAYLYRGTAFLGSLYLMLLFFFAIADRPRREVYDLSMHPLHKYATLLTLFAAVSLVVVSLYISFTPVGYPTVNGCQFRYLFPLFPVFFYFLGNVRLRVDTDERKLTAFALGGGALFNLVLFAQSILERF